MKHIIDTTKLPSIPNCLKVDQHDTSLGEIDPTQIELYLDDEQKDTIIRGGQLREKLKGKPVLNATVLDYLYEHQKLIPVSWKDKTKDGYTQYIYFWGTIYRDSSGNLYVRYLYFFDGRWYSSYDRLGSDWGGRSPAALRALPSEPKSLGLEAAIKIVKKAGYQISKVI